MTLEEKKQHVENILKGGDFFDDLLELSPEVLNFRPAPDRWTIHEHIIHCLDVDAANFTRYRVGIVHPGTEIIGMDDEWTSRLNYGSIGIAEAVETIKLLRRMTCGHMVTMIGEDWKKFTILYRKYGVLDFETFIPVFFNHPVSHREMIDKLLEEHKAL